MTHTFINLPPAVEDAVADILGSTNSREVVSHAKSLHDRYMAPDTRPEGPLVRSGKDILAYISLRFPATYAQIAGALYQLRERMPDWKPVNVLDLGCGPGTGLFASRAVWPTITKATAIDQSEHFLSLGRDIANTTDLPIDINWKKQNIQSWVNGSDDGSYDLTIVANVLNELSADLAHDLLHKLANQKNGVVLLLEPGTAHGFKMVQSAAEKAVKYRPLIAPYINGTLVQSRERWVHFSQRFIRPAFQRNVRQKMRESPLMASDWEETKYSFVAFGDTPNLRMPYGVTIGPVEISHGYLLVPLLTQNAVDMVKVMKRHKDAYRFAKNLAWGDAVYENLGHSTSQQ